tara:strand:- start:311 stop:661 length:351 start_codon:yes stop_codon:yes gene_type:complete
MSKFSDFAHLGTTSHETGTTVPPVAPATPEPVAPPVYDNPLDEMPVANGQEPPRPEEEVAELTAPPASTVFSTDDLDYKTKYELEQIGRTVGIELDRRLSHHKLVKQLKEHIANTQ